MTAKKGHIVWLMAMVLCIACSHRDDPVPQTHEETGTPIRFSGGMQDVENVTQGVKSHQAGPSQEAVTRSGMEAMTRAGRPLEELHSAFRVWGYKNMSRSGETFSELQTVMNAYRVEWTMNTAMTTTTNTHDWEYILPGYSQTIKFWDLSARAYRFFGVTASMYTGTKEDVTSPYPTYEPQEDHTTYRITFTADADDEDVTPYFSRLWFSTGELPTYEDKQFLKPVQLEFLQPLARVRFMFKSGDPSVDLETLQLEDTEFKPLDISKHITTSGTFTVAYPLTGTATKESWTVTPDDYRTAFTKAWATEADWVTVLPAHGSDQGVYRLTVTVNGEAKWCTVPAEFMTWLPGYEYTYIFKVNGELGVELGTVTSAYTAWQSGRDADHEIYNW